MKTLNRRHAIGGIAAAAATIGLPALGQVDRRIVLGQSAAFSGAAAQLGIQMNRGARLYFDAVNAAGGINGTQIELRTLDDQYEPDSCRPTPRRFIKDDVFALFGYVGTPTSLAALPQVNQSKIPFFGPFTGAEALRDPFSRNVFHVRASYYDETALIVKQLTSLGLKKIAVFRQNDSYGQAGYDGVVRALKTQGLAPVAVGLVERNTVDVAAAVGAIVPSQPDAVVQISAYKSCAAFIRRGPQGGLRRHLLQRVVRRHAGVGRRTGSQGQRHRGQPGDAVSVQPDDADCRASTWLRCSAPVATTSPTTRAWKATSRPSSSPRA